MYLAIIFLILILVIVSTFLFTDEYYSIVYMYHSSFTHLFIDAPCSFSTFFGYCEYCYWEHYCTCFFGGISSFWLFYVSTRRGILGHLVILCLTFWGTSKLFKLFSMRAAWFHIPISTVDNFQFLYVLANTCDFTFFKSF